VGFFGKKAKQFGCAFGQRCYIVWTVGNNGAQQMMNQATKERRAAERKRAKELAKLVSIAHAVEVLAGDNIRVALVEVKMEGPIDEVNARTWSGWASVPCASLQTC
jgi:hypothetical protein